MRSRIPLALALLVLIAYFSSPVYAQTIIDHKVLEGDYGHMQVFAYVYKDEEEDLDEDFYAFQIRVHAKTIPGHMFTELLIYSPEGLCDRWEPTAGRKGGSFSFSYGKTISFSVTIPEAYISVGGVNTYEISWRVSPCDDSWDIDFGAGFYVPQGSQFHWRIKVHVYCYTNIAGIMVFLWEDWANWNSPVFAMKTGVNGYFYVPTVVTSPLKIEFLFDNAGLVGDQIGGASPYGTTMAYPDRYVNILDCLFIADRAMCEEGDSKWNYMADVTADRYIGIDDILTVAYNFGGGGTYITGLSNVTVTFNTGEVETPDANGFVTIPQGATNFNVTRYGNPIGAMIIFW